MDIDPQERRTKRDSVFRVATITIPGNDRLLTGRVRDVSNGGVRLDLVSGLEVGLIIEVAIGGGPAVPGTITWIADGKCGVVFDHPNAPVGNDHVIRTDGTPTTGWMADMRDGYRRR